MKGTIKKIEVVHRENFSPMKGNGRYARIVVWADMEDNKRVWVTTVEGGLDSLKIEAKLEMLDKFFGGLVGREISFVKRRAYFARCVPKEFRISYREIKEIMKKCDGPSGTKKLSKVHKERMEKAALEEKESLETEREWRKYWLGVNRANRKEAALKLGLPANATSKMIQAERDRLEILRKQDELRELNEKRKNAMHLWFVKRINPKHGHEQWQAEFEGCLHVLRREDTYDSTENLVPIEEVCEIGHNIVLVKRI
jgi:hypothetical protein